MCNSTVGGGDVPSLFLSLSLSLSWRRALSLSLSLSLSLVCYETGIHNMVESYLQKSSDRHQFAEWLAEFNSARNKGWIYIVQWGEIKFQTWKHSSPEDLVCRLFCTYENTKRKMESIDAVQNGESFIPGKYHGNHRWAEAGVFPLLKMLKSIAVSNLSTIALASCLPLQPHRRAHFSVTVKSNLENLLSEATTNNHPIPPFHTFFCVVQHVIDVIGIGDQWGSGTP